MAHSAQKAVWKTPSGGQYVGTSPPPGSEYLGIWYPRGSTLGGSAGINFMAVVYPHDDGEL